MNLKTKPICAKCGTEVEEMREEQDVTTLKMTFEARCHGKREVVRVPEELLQYASSISFGLAFADEQRSLR